MVSILYIIPVDNSPNRTFRVTIPVDGENKTFKFRFVYNVIGKYWMLTIMDLSGNEIISNLNLVSTFGYDEGDLLRMVRYMRIGSLFICDKDANTFSAPDDTQLGNAYMMAWGDTR